MPRHRLDLSYANRVRGRMKSIGGEGDMAGFEMQRLAVIVHMRIKLVYISPPLCSH
jgi:hypothetical protein